MPRKLFFSSFGKTMLILWLAHIVMDFFTGIWPIYKTIAQIDLAKAGLIAGVSGFLGEILQLGFGYFCDRGYRKIILMIGITLASCIVWITFTSSLFGSFWILLLLMLGSGSFHPAGMGYAGGLSKEHKGKTILLFSSGGALGLGISQIVFTKVFHSFNGHALILLAPVAAILILIASHRFPDLQQTRPLSKKELIAPLIASWKPLSLLYCAQITSYSISLAFLFLLPDLMAGKSSSQWLIMGGSHLCFILGSAMVLPFIGALTDRIGTKKVLLTAIVGSMLLLYTLLRTPELSSLAAITLLISLGGFMQSINPLIVSWGHKLVPESPSTISALLMGFAWCFTSFGPTCAGFLCRRFQEGAVVKTLSMMGALLILTFLFILFMRTEQEEEEPAAAEPSLAADISSLDKEG